MRVNDSEGAGANATYWFSTQSQTPVISGPGPSNASTEQDMYPLLNVTVTDPQGDNFNISWSTNATGEWVYFNSTCSNGSYNQRATFVNASDTMYWWTVKVNDSDGNWVNATYHFTTDTYSWGNWSDWWTFNYTVSGPENLSASTYSKTEINLTWDSINGGVDAFVLVVNESGWLGYPLNPQNGNEIYYGTATTFYKTDNGGQDWTTKKLPTSRASSVLAVDPANSNVVYMGTQKLEKPGLINY